MAYWNFLIQKEGESSWQPIKSQKIEIETGKYRVVAQSDLINIDIEVRLSHESVEEVPPRRRFQKRSRRTSREGLVVVMPFTYLKSGLWELSCSGDIMLDAMSESSHQAVKLQVLPTASETIPTPEAISPQEELISSDKLEAQRQAEKDVDTEEEVDRENENKNVSSPAPSVEDPSYSIPPSPPLALSPSGSLPISPSPPPPISASPRHRVSPSRQPEAVELAPFDENSVAFTSQSAEIATSENPLMAQSLETLEQIMQQVVEPVLQEFEESEFHNLQPSSPKLDASAISESEHDLETLINQQGFTLSLDDQAFVARRGEVFTITGKLARTEVNSDTDFAHNQLKSAILRYQLRDPQTSKVLIEVDKSISQVSLPLAFSHTLEIPAQCHTRLILGKVTLYGDASVALANQAFSVTANLDELLGTIIPESKTMPVAKMLGFANNSEDWETNWAKPPIQISAPTPLNEAFLQMVNNPQEHKPLPLQISSKQVLPPQLYPKNDTQKLSKSLQLPNFPKLQSAASNETINPASIVEQVEASQENIAAQTPDSEPTQTSVEDTSSEIASPKKVIGLLSATSIEDTLTVTATETVSSEIKTDELESLVTVIDSRQQTRQTEVDTANIDSENTEQMPAPISSDDTDDKATSQPESEQNAGDKILGVSQIEDRFWLRLNSLATDAESAQWLTSESSIPSNQVEVTQELNSEIVTDSEQSLDAEQFLGEYKGDFDSATTETEQLQPLPFLENIPRDIAIPEPSLSDSTANTDWLAQEIVVEDEQLSESQLSSLRNDALGMIALTEQASTQSAEGVISPLQLETPIPEPKILIPTDELTAGESLIVRIRVPAYPSRLYVKLWIQDRQSRSLRDGPHSLVDFLPNDTGELEAMTQLTVPYGSLEIRLEAIAIDIYSQRESRKVGVERIVVHPHLSGSDSVDGFEL